MVGVEDLARRHDVGAVDGLLVPGQVEHGVEPGADPAGLGALVGRPFQLADLAQRRLAHLLGQVRRLDAAAEVVGAVRLVLAEFLADRGELLAQQELALRLVHAVADVVADLVGHLELGEVLAGPLGDAFEPGRHIGRLEQVALLLQGQVGRVSGQVGDVGRIVDALHRVDHLPGVAPLQDRDHEPLELSGQLAGVLGRLGVVDRCGLDPERGARVR